MLCQASHTRFTIHRSRKGCARKAGLNSINPRQGPLLLSKSASESEILIHTSRTCIPLFSMWTHQKTDCANISCLQHTWYCDSFKSLEIPWLLNTSVPKAMVPFFAKKRYITLFRPCSLHTILVEMAFWLNRRSSPRLTCSYKPTCVYMLKLWN